MSLDRAENGRIRICIVSEVHVSQRNVSVGAVTTTDLYGVPAGGFRRVMQPGVLLKSVDCPRFPMVVMVQHNTCLTFPNAGKEQAEGRVCFDRF
jgi:hypothetical protein